MALKGTLKDFGIADILQLIGQQQKTGTLHLKNKDEEVDVAFRDGNIVRAESTNRKKRELIGAMLVRAELITEVQLAQALEIQRRSLKRLGDVLVQAHLLDPERFRQMVQLQATETLYGLFHWKSGTYQFEQGDVEVDADAMTPLRAESVLMEGFRMVDEWPVIRKVISRYDMTFQVVKAIPPPASGGGDALDSAFDDAFSEGKKEQGGGEFHTVGDPERRVFELIVANPARDVRKLFDLACLGEFETCKALLNLVNLDYLRPVYPEGRAQPLQRGAVPTLVGWVSGAVGRVIITMGVLGLLGLLGSRMDLDSISLTASPSATYADPAAQHLISRAQISRIIAALEVYELEKGEVPEKLEVLVEAGLLAREDLHYPWRDTYHYRRIPSGGFVLLPPLR